MVGLKAASEFGTLDYGNLNEGFQFYLPVWIAKVAVASFFIIKLDNDHNSTARWKCVSKSCEASNRIKLIESSFIL